MSELPLINAFIDQLDLIIHLVALIDLAKSLTHQALSTHLID